MDSNFNATSSAMNSTFAFVLEVQCCSLVPVGPKRLRVRHRTPTKIQSNPEKAFSRHDTVRLWSCVSTL